MFGRDWGILNIYDWQNKNESFQSNSKTENEKHNKNDKFKYTSKVKTREEHPKYVFRWTKDVKLTRKHGSNKWKKNKKKLRVKS